MTINITAKNWMTALGGFLAGIPTIVISSGMALSPKWTHILSIVGGVGVLIIGLAAKDSNTHSTQDQVARSTAAEAKAKP